MSMRRGTIILFLAAGLTLTQVMNANQSNAAEIRRVEETQFGKMPDGALVRLFALRNAQGMVARVITYGAILTELQAPDRKGTMASVVLGTTNLEAYLKGFRAPAAIIGRVANRIAKARFTLEARNTNSLPTMVPITSTGPSTK